MGVDSRKVDAYLETLGLGDVTVNRYGTCHSRMYNVQWKNTPGDIVPLQVTAIALSPKHVYKNNTIKICIMYLLLQSDVIPRYVNSSKTFR